MAGFRASPLKPLPNRSAKSRMDEYTQQQLGTRCSGQLSIQPNVLGNLSCSALGQHVDQVASGPCPPLDGIDDNLSALSCSTMPHTPRSEAHTSELQSLMRISYAVFCLKKKI